MNQRATIILLFILLLLSLFLNGILGTVLYRNILRMNHTMHHYPFNPGGPGRGAFGLDREPDPRIIALRDTFFTAKKELMAELAKDPLNEARIMQLIDNSVSAQGSMERALGLKLLEKRKTMTPEEAQKHFTSLNEDFRRPTPRR